MRSRNDLVAVLLWTAVCTAGGLWSLDNRPGPCGYSRCHGLAGHNRNIFSYKKNPAAYLEYGRRMRTGFGYQVRAMCGQNADLIKKFKAGDYKEHKEVFESETNSFCNSRLESLEIFDHQQVPDVLEKSHAKISSSHRLCYESIQALKEAFSAEGAEQKRLVRESEKKLKEAWITGDAGVKLHNKIWAKTTI